MDIRAEALQRIAQAILVATGSSSEEADKVAQKLVGANLAGHDSHGVIRVPQYVGQVQDDTIVPNQSAEVVRETEAVTVLDGRFGYGQVVGGGTTNPIAMGIPVEGSGPVVLDFATSATAEGKVRVARNKGALIPPDCLLDAEGRPTTDPNDLYTDPPGTLLPFGGATAGHKGGALWLLVDLLAGGLTGGGCSRPPEGALRFSSSMLSIVIAPQAYGDAGAFGAEMRRYVEFVKSARPRTPCGEVLLPGEPERRARAERLASGIPIDPTTWEHIIASGVQVGLERADLEAMAG
jgi:LDH2 family malate/lactate/ureidoglycolate dehydrogenase